MPAAIQSVLLVGVGALGRDLAGELSARGILAREATLMQLGASGETEPLLVLGPAAARAARLDVVRRFQSDARPIVVLSHAAAAADQLRTLSAARVVHVPPTGSVVQIATAIVQAVAPDWDATETVRPPPAALPPEVMAEMTGNSPRSDPPEPVSRPRSEPPEELDSSLLESVRPEPQPPPVAEPERDWPEPEPPKPKPKRSLSPLVWGGAAAALLGLITIVAVTVALSSGSDDGDLAPAPVTPEEATAPADEELRAEEPGPSAADPTEPELAEAAEPEPAEPEPAEPDVASPVPSRLGSPEEQIAAARAAGGPRDARESDVLTAQAHRAISAGEIATANEQLERALALDPDNPRAWAGLGRVSVAKGQPQAGVRWLELAVGARGRRAEYHLWLGDARRAAGDEAGARQSWESALRRDPDNAEARSRLR